jgi:2'-5' RNA ligase
VWPPADVVADITALARPAIDGLRWTTEDQWHATLRFLGDADVDDATARLAGIDATSTVAVMGPVTDRFGQATLHAPVAGLDALAEAVAAAFGPEDRPFRGHLTLARARPRRGVDLRPLCGVPLAGEWPVDEVTLVASELHPKGARYEIVARQPLGR